MDYNQMLRDDLCIAGWIIVIALVVRVVVVFAFLAIIFHKLLDEVK